MEINIKTAESSWDLIKKFTQKFSAQGGSLPENVVPRIALSYSISKGRKMNVVEIKDSKGKEYKDSILFSKSNRSYFIAMVCQHYQIYKSDENIRKFVKMHIDDGLELMDKFFESNPAYSVFDFLIEVVERGIESIEHTDNTYNPVENSALNLYKGFFPDFLNIVVGKDSEGADISIIPNNTNIYNNCHIAVAGGTGSGKTQFALEMLYQISEKSNGAVNFIYLDFKGLKKEDKEHLRPFFNKTKAKFIDAPHTQFPINPLTFIDNINEINRKLGISKFVDIIVSYSTAGAKQSQFLKDAVKQAFASKKGGQYPTIADVFKQVQRTLETDKNKVTGALEGLADLNVFSDENNPDFLNQNYYLSLSGDLPNDIRITATFLIINYLYNVFMNMEDTPVTSGAKGLRYVLLIDEAQNVFKDKKNRTILEKILREIRSKGVAVMMLSQDIGVFNQPDFDFSSMCELTFLLDIKDKANTRAINKFLGFSDADSRSIARNMEKIQRGQAISNVKEFRKGELLTVEQFYKRL
jgi:DNA sulfur modification protein DndE